MYIVNRRAPVRKACRYRTTGIITTGRRIIGKITISVTAIVLICWMPGKRLIYQEYKGLKISDCVKYFQNFGNIRISGNFFTRRFSHP